MVGKQQASIRNERLLITLSRTERKSGSSPPLGRKGATERSRGKRDAD